MEDIYSIETNLNHSKIYSKDFLSVIITLVNNVNGSVTVVLYEMTMNDTGKRARILKHSYGRFVMVAFDKN